MTMNKTSPNNLSEHVRPTTTYLQRPYNFARTYQKNWEWSSSSWGRWLRSNTSSLLTTTGTSGWPLTSFPSWVISVLGHWGSRPLWIPYSINGSPSNTDRSKRALWGWSLRGSCKSVWSCGRRSWPWRRGSDLMKQPKRRGNKKWQLNRRGRRMKRESCSFKGWWG